MPAASPGFKIHAETGSLLHRGPAAVLCGYSGRESGGQNHLRFPGAGTLRCCKLVLVSGALGARLCDWQSRENHRENPETLSAHCTIPGFLTAKHKSKIFGCL